MKNLIKALSDFQNECPIIHKDTKGHNYTYADLPQIFSVINPLLKKHKLCFTQLLENDGIRTILFHVESGEQLESFTNIPYAKLGGMNEFQSIGSGISYFRRYCISSILGLVTDKDTDAANTSGKQSTNLDTWATALVDVKSVQELEDLFLSKKHQIAGNKEIIELFTTRKQQLSR
jgi:hypothetical protein